MRSSSSPRKRSIVRRQVQQLRSIDRTASERRLGAPRIGERGERREFDPAAQRQLLQGPPPRQAHEQLAQPLVGQSIRIDVERHLSHDRYQFEAEAMKISVTSLSTISGIRRPSTSVSSCVES